MLQLLQLLQFSKGFTTPLILHLYLYIYLYIYKYRDIFEGVKSLLRTAALQQLQQIGKILLQN